MATITKIKNIDIHQLTQAQYFALVMSGEINSDGFYFITDDTSANDLMSGYSKNTEQLPIVESDSINEAIGKLEKKVDDIGESILYKTEELITLSDGNIDLSLGSVFNHNPTTNTTYIISNVIANVVHPFTLIITQPLTPVDLTFPISVKWNGGNVPNMATGDKTYMLKFLTIDGGTTWFGTLKGEF